MTLPPVHAPFRSLVGASLILLLLLLATAPLRSVLPLHAAAGLSTLLALGLALAWSRHFWGVSFVRGLAAPVASVRVLLAGALLAACVNSFQVLQLRLFPVLEPLAEHYAQLLEPLLRPGDAHLIPVVFLVVALLPGLLEEAFFRGAMRERVQGWTARRRVLVIALLFALVHLNPLTFLALLVAGCVFGGIAEKAGGWWLAGLAHVAFNAMSGLVWPRLPESFEEVATAILVLVLCIPVLLLSLWRLGEPAR